jgi:hypothetical protein
MRQEKFAKTLNSVKQDVHATGCVLQPSRKEHHQFAHCMTGDEYMADRITPELQRSSQASHTLLVIALIARFLTFASTAVGTVLATVGLAKWIAVTVALSTAINGWLRHFRIEERRAAHLRAVAVMSAQQTNWQSLGREKRAQQKELDELVQAVENALEAVLPPAAEFDGGV